MSKWRSQSLVVLTLFFTFVSVLSFQNCSHSELTPIASQSPAVAATDLTQQENNNSTGTVTDDNNSSDSTTDESSNQNTQDDNENNTDTDDEDTQVPVPQPTPMPTPSPTPTPTPVPTPKPDPLPANAIKVSDVNGLVSVLASTAGNVTIALADGIYNLTNVIEINKPNIVIRSQSGNRQAVVLNAGGGVINGAYNYSNAIFHIFGVMAPGFEILDMTLNGAKNNLVLLYGGTAGSPDNFHAKNIIFKDSQQALVSAYRAHNGIIENSSFEYSLNVTPDIFSGGILIGAGSNWIMRGNLFKNVSPANNESSSYAAIDIRDKSENNLVENNKIMNCKLGIVFQGLSSGANFAGIIRNNMIYRAENRGSGLGIGALGETAVHVYNNTIYIADAATNITGISYSGANIHYIANNLTNRVIRAGPPRATATVINNITDAQASWFVNLGQGDLHLSSAVSAVVNKGAPVSGLTHDYDGVARKGNPDIGADEY